MEKPNDLDSAILARAAYEEYNRTGPNPWKTFDGRDVPAWLDLPGHIQDKWIAGIKAALGRWAEMEPTVARLRHGGEQP